MRLAHDDVLEGQRPLLPQRRGGESVNLFEIVARVVLSVYPL
jgi:hypothetical protein